MNIRVTTGRMRLAFMACCLGIGILIPGCTQKQGEGPAVGMTNMQNLMRLRNKYMSTHRGQNPPNEAEFKKFAKGLKEADLKELGITDVDAVFVSPRDKQPYEINYKASTGMGGGPGGTKDKEKLAKKETMSKPPVFAYEKTGVSGKRFVGLAMGGSVIEVTEEEFNSQYAP